MESSSRVNMLPPPARQSVSEEVLFPSSFIDCFCKDPFVEEFTKKFSKGPAMQKTINLLRSGKFNEEELYPSNMMDADALELEAAAKENMKGLLERHPSMIEVFDKIKKHMKEDPVYKSFANNTDPTTALIRYFNSKGEALGFSVDTSADNGVFGLIQREVPKEYIVHEAASLGDVEGLKEALKSFPDINKRDNQGMTALVIACALGKFRCARVLIDAGIEVNALDENRNTALHYAAFYGKKKCVWLLLKHGADTTLQNNKRKTPCQLAKSSGQSIELLRLIKRPRTLSA